MTITRPTIASDSAGLMYHSGARSVYFNGSNARVYVHYQAITAGKTNTIEFWFYMTEQNYNRIMFRTDYNGNYPYYEIYIDASGNIKAFYLSSAYANAYLQGPEITFNEWHYVMLRVEPTGGSLYYDTAWVDTNATVPANASQGPNRVTTIGCGNSQSPTVYHDFFKGWIDDFRISGTNQTPNTNYYNPIVASGTALYVFEETSPLSPAYWTFQDYSGNNCLDLGYNVNGGKNFLSSGNYVLQLYGVQSEEIKKTAGVIEMPMPMSDSTDKLVFDLMGTGREITIEGLASNSEVDLQNYAKDLIGAGNDTLITGEQGNPANGTYTYSSESLNRSNTGTEVTINVVITDVSAKIEAGHPNQLSYSITMVEYGLVI